MEYVHKKPHRLYCSVHGCLNTTIRNTGKLTFFKLPTQPERLSEWLRLICREDLARKTANSCVRVCEAHFDKRDILPKSNRKILKKNAIPSLNLPFVDGSEKEPEIDEVLVKEEKWSDITDKYFNLEDDESLEASTNICFETLRKRKLEFELLQCRRKLEEQNTIQKASYHYGPQTSTAEVNEFSPVVIIENDIPIEVATPLTGNYTETTKNLQAPSKRKLPRGPIETENKIQKIEESTFHKLCDKFLTKELAILVKAQTRVKLYGKGNKYDRDYVLFCLNLYSTSQQAYRLLQNALGLPSTSTINKLSFPITTEINEEAMSMLKIKVAQMSDTEKNCSVMIDSTMLKTNLFYDIKEDRIIGFHEVEGWQMPEPAVKALVIMVRGIFVNWTQPIAYTLLSECTHYDEITKWIDGVLEKLFEIGLNVRAFVSSPGARSVSIDKPYFLQKGRKIYYIYDVPHLIKDIRNNFMQYDFHFGDSVAKYEHIIQFYVQDVRKDCRLAHKLTNSHITPTNVERTKVSYATQLLSDSVARGISTYVDFNAIEESGRETANFITKMNNLFDFFNSINLKHNYEYKRAYRGNATQKAFLSEMLNFFEGLKLIDLKDGSDCTSNVNFIHGFRITITSLLLLFDDLKREGHTFLFTRRLNQDPLEKIFGQLQTKNGKPTKTTCKQFICAFKKIYFSSIIKLPKEGGNYVDDLGKLQVTLAGGGNSSTKVEEISNNDNDAFDSSVRIKRSEYNQLDMPEKYSIFYICRYLLKRCGEIHNDCESMKSYIKSKETQHNSTAEIRYLKHRDYENLQNLLMIPCDDFVEYVEKMEGIFRVSFKRHHIKCKLTAAIYNNIKDIPFSAPCSCFPKTYLIKLFIRMRIFYTLKFNNKAFRKSLKKTKCFSVPDL